MEQACDFTLLIHRCFQINYLQAASPIDLQKETKRTLYQKHSLGGVLKKSCLKVLQNLQRNNYASLTF